MASRAEGWVPGARVRFGSLDFIIAIDGSLVQVQEPVSPTSDGIAGTLQGPRLVGQRQDAPAVWSPNIFDNARLEHQLQMFLGPQSTKGDLRCVAYSLSNVATQLSGGSPIPPDLMFDRATMMFPFGLGNTSQHLQHHLARHHHPGGGRPRAAGRRTRRNHSCHAKER